MKALILRFDAPMMSFGSTVVDRHGFIRQFPARSMIAGLLGNAVGYEHTDFKKLEALQSRIVFAARCDRPGRPWVDFQRVDLGQAYMRQGWTTRGVPEGRAGSVSDGTHIRLRHYWADSVYTLALTLDPIDPEPGLIDLAFALREPERPLFFGRKCCIPSVPIFVREAEGETLRGILEAEPPIESHRSQSDTVQAQWSPDETEAGTEIFVTEDRDWANQVHVGRRSLRQGTMRVVRSVSTEK